MFLIQQFVSAGHSNSRKVNKINGTKKHQFCCVLQTSLDTKVHMTTKTHSEHSFSLSSMLLSKVTSVKLAEEIKSIYTLQVQQMHFKMFPHTPSTGTPPTGLHVGKQKRDYSEATFKTRVDPQGSLHLPAEVSLTSRTWSRSEALEHELKTEIQTGGNVPKSLSGFFS